MNLKAEKIVNALSKVLNVELTLEKKEDETGVYVVNGLNEDIEIVFNSKESEKNEGFEIISEDGEIKESYDAVEILKLINSNNTLNEGFIPTLDEFISEKNQIKLLEKMMEKCEDEDEDEDIDESLILGAILGLVGASAIGFLYGKAATRKTKEERLEAFAKSVLDKAKKKSKDKDIDITIERIKELVVAEILLGEIKTKDDVLKRINEIEKEELKESMNEGEVKNKEDFEEYAKNLLKKQHGDDYDEEKAKEVINGLIDKYKEDWGAMVGALQNS